MKYKYLEYILKIFLKVTKEMLIQFMYNDRYKYEIFQIYNFIKFLIFFISAQEQFIINTHY